ncbi:hypothetical protein TWF281_004828 [Arthrobotrys megalospora]
MDRRHGREAYTIGWICALSLELTAAVAALDERHPALPQDELDDNAYEFGRVGHYNIIIVCLPAGVYGTTSAATAVIQMRRSFPSITAGLMVGIGGGVPLPHDIRLGDVVVSEPVPGFGGVLQYDFGKTVQEGRFIQTGVLDKPPKLFLTAIAKLKSEHTVRWPRIGIEDLIAALIEEGRIPKQFARPPANSDRLFKAEYDHPAVNQDSTNFGGTEYSSCDHCDPEMVIARDPRPYNQAYIHYGLIASGNQVVKHGVTRDLISREGRVLCFEMEAAGLMDALPSLVIRGICDYSDSHKNKIWQPYAALAAATFAKELLLQLPPRNNRTDGADSIEDIKIDLPTAEGAAFGSYADQNEPECLEGTRVDLCADIQRWVDDPQGKGIFWLVGRAGTGKSTISRTIARWLQDRGQLAASFFFKRGEADRSSATIFFTTIAVQLAYNIRGIASCIQNGIRSNPDISKKALKEQFEKLIFRPLSEMLPESPQLKCVVLVDALDECEQKREIEIIIGLLARLQKINTIDVRVFVTSRPDLPIRPTFDGLPDRTYQNIALHEVPNIEQDISTFLSCEFSNIRSRRRLPQDWPGDQTRKKLAEMAVPLFIYAATLCRFVGDESWDPDERVKLVLNCQTNSSRLHTTYLPILHQLIIDKEPAEEKQLIKECRQIIGTIINLFSPLSVTSLSSLLGIPKGSVECRINSLQSVLDVPNDRYAPVRTFHLSFRDCLLDPSIREESPFWVDEQGSHAMIASRCVELMSRELKKDICNLNLPGVLRSEIKNESITEYISPELRYACRYWTHHLERCGHRLVDNDHTHKFLEEHLLHWLEATSLLNIASENLLAVDTLKSLTKAEDTASEKISEFVSDIKRFIVKNQYIISQAPLQVYVSALLFAPNKSIVRQKFDTNRTVWWLERSPQVQDEWGSLLQTLEGCERPADAISFSSDGKLLASAGSDGRIRLWSAVTGELTHILEGHADSVSIVAFSPDDTILLSATAFGTIELWDSATWESTQIISSKSIKAQGQPYQGVCRGTLEGFTVGNRVNAVAFPPDGGVQAFGHDGRVIKSWNAATGELLRILDYDLEFDLGEGLGALRDIAVSSHGRVLVSVSIFSPRVKFSQKTRSVIRLWDLASAKLLWTRRAVSSGAIALSPDGAMLAVAFDGQALEIWDTASSKTTKIIEGLGPVSGCCLRFSSDGKTVALSSKRVVTLWDVASGKVLQTIQDTHLVKVIAFSYDNTILASALRDGKIRFWDATSKSGGSTATQLPGTHVERQHLTFVPTVMELSPSGSVLASVYKVTTLWNTGSGKPLQKLWGGQDQVVTAIVFSPDGNMLATRVDSEVILWDVASGRRLRTFVFWTYQKRSDKTLVFSPNSRVLILVCHGSGRNGGGIITPWDTASGKELTNLYTTNNVGKLFFPLDGQHIQADEEILPWCSEIPLRDTHDIHVIEGESEPPGTVVTLRDKEWLTRGNERLIWLPHEHRPVTSVANKDFFALANRSGSVLIFRFAFGNSVDLPLTL